MGCSTPERQVGSCSPSLPSPVTFYLPKMCWSVHRQSAPLSCLYPFKLFCHHFYKVSRGSRDKPEVCSPGLTSPHPLANPPHLTALPLTRSSLPPAHPPPLTSRNHQPTQCGPYRCSWPAPSPSQPRRDTHTCRHTSRVLRSSSSSFFFGHTGIMREFPRQRSNLCHSSNQSHSSDNAGSLTH